MLAGTLVFASSICAMAKDADPSAAGVNEPILVTQETPKETEKEQTQDPVIQETTEVETEEIKVILSKESLEGAFGREVQLTATVFPEGEDPHVSWSSSNPDVASVEQDGTVSFWEIGTAVITAKASNGASAQCTVEVLEDVNMEDAMAVLIAGAFFWGMTEYLPEDCQPYRDALKTAMDDLTACLEREDLTIKNQAEVDALTQKVDQAAERLEAYAAAQGYEIGIPYVIHFLDIETEKELAEDKTGTFNIFEIDWEDEEALLQLMEPAVIDGYEWLEEETWAEPSEDGKSFEIFYYYQAVKDPEIIQPSDQKPKPESKPIPEKPSQNVQASGLTNIPKTSDPSLPFVPAWIGLCAAGIAWGVQKRRKRGDVR